MLAPGKNALVDTGPTAGILQTGNNQIKCMNFSFNAVFGKLERPFSPFFIWNQPWQATATVSVSATLFSGRTRNVIQVRARGMCHFMRERSREQEGASEWAGETERAAERTETKTLFGSMCSLVQPWGEWSCGYINDHRLTFDTLTLFCMNGLKNVVRLLLYEKG